MWCCRCVCWAGYAAVLFKNWQLWVVQGNGKHSGVCVLFVICWFSMIKGLAIKDGLILRMSFFDIVNRNFIYNADE